MAKRFVIKDYKSMTPDLMALLVEAYPDGFEYDSEYFTNSKRGARGSRATGDPGYEVLDQGQYDLGSEV